MYINIVLILRCLRHKYGDKAILDAGILTKMFSNILSLNTNDMGDDVFSLFGLIQDDEMYDMINYKLHILFFILNKGLPQIMLAEKVSESTVFEWMHDIADDISIHEDDAYMAIMCWNDVFCRDNVSYIDILHEEAEKENIEAQLRLGRCYDTGIGVMKNEKKAVEWYHKAALHGNVEAQYYLGCHYSKGCGVEIDHVEATRWFEKASNQCHPFAQQYLCEQYATGKGVKKDKNKACKLYRESNCQEWNEFFLAKIQQDEAWLQEISWIVDIEKKE